MNAISKIPSGFFITFEGGEGTGKSTQIKLLVNKLQKAGYETLVTREPGGTKGAEIIRHVILSGAAEKFGEDVEAMLFSAARADHVAHVIRPALQQGHIVLCDRFVDSTRVYQGLSNKVEMKYLKMLERVACEEVWPNLTLVLDLDPKEGMKRAKERRKAGADADRYEKEGIRIQNQRRNAFLQVAEEDKNRCVVVDASGTTRQVANRIWKEVKQKLEQV